ncbi:MAG: hypothetical protein J7L03_05295, partial [Caldisericaceae bacterium]|nr:hypothetical protein [Caldisericaceae bacterium]
PLYLYNLKDPILISALLLIFFLKIVVIITMINRIKNHSDEIKSREDTIKERFFVTHFVRSSRMNPFCHP